MQQLTPDDLKLQKHFGIQAKSLILKKQKKTLTEQSQMFMLPHHWWLAH